MIVSAASPRIPHTLVDQLVVGGRMVIPLERVVAYAPSDEAYIALATTYKALNRPGDAVVLDFGGVAQAYCSDITRTWWR